jgi:hypothetical protein
MPDHKRHFWRRGRLYFRRFRFAVWLALLVLIGVVWYLNRVGLPGFVKRPLLEKLRARGLDLQFSRLRLRFYQGLVADNVSFGRADEPQGPQLTAAEVTLGVNLRALLRFQLQPEAVGLRQGRFVWPIVETNHAERRLTIENIHARLRFLPEDQWALDQFTASFGGARFELSGTLAHASAAREWNFLRAPPPSAPQAGRARLRELADVIEHIQFREPPEFRLQLSGDARDAQSLSARLDITAPDADTAWGDLTHGRLTMRLFPAGTNGQSSAELLVKAASAKTELATTTGLELSFHAASLQDLADLANAEMSVTGAPPGRMLALRGVTMLAGAHLSATAEEAKTRWASITNLQFELALSGLPEQPDSIRADMSLLAAGVATEWGRGANASLTANWDHALTNTAPRRGQCRGSLDDVVCDWGQAGRVEIEASMARPSPGPGDPPAALAASAAWWTNLAPFILDVDAQVREVRSPKLAARAFRASAHWHAPELTVTNLEARFDSGSVKAGTSLNISNRVFSFRLTSEADPHQFEPLLSEPVRKFLGQLTWPQPPLVEGRGELILPAWTNRQPDWAAEVQPTLQLSGQFALDHGGAFGGVPATSARAHFSYSNQTWRLPDLAVTTARGSLEASHEANERAQSVYWKFRSTVDPESVRPLLDAGTARALDLFSFTNLPQIQAEFWACSNDVKRIGLRGQVVLTNFAFRGQAVASLETPLDYTNGFLQFTGPRLRRAGGQEMTADSVGVEFQRQLVFLTNGNSTVDPQVFATAIGPHIVRALEPYHFDRPPAVRAQGIIPLHGEDDADLYFHVAGGPFRWWHFQMPAVEGDIHWQGQHLSLTDVRTDFYGGKANGWAKFEFHPGGAATYAFSLGANDARLQKLMADLSTHTNKLEGRLSGRLVVTKASTADWRLTDGYGNVDLRDGTIWDIPVFGVFSDVLNGIAPGLGNSRANFGSATFGLTNGVIYSDNLEIRSPTLRLRYRGNIDLEENVNARVEAEFLRNMWLVGPLVSTVFWPVTKVFEFKVTGTLEDPKAEPVYLIPKILLMPLHPLRTLKEMVPDNPGNSRGSPPQWPQY